MSFDIYGVRLKKGHCEVHPDWPETYPCELCLQDHLPPEPTEEEYREMICEAYGHPRGHKEADRCPCGEKDYSRKEE